MKKQVLALLTVAALGVTVANAAPQTEFQKGQFQLDAGAYNMEAETDVKAGEPIDENFGIATDKKWNFTGGLTYGLTDKTALQYNYTGLNTGDVTLKADGESENIGESANNAMHEVNVIQSLNKNFAVYGGWARISGDIFDNANNIAQAGLIAKTPIGSRVEVYGKAGVGTKKTTTWEAGLGAKLTDDLDLNVGYKYINTELDDNQNVSFKGIVTGLSYRFGGKSTPVAAPVAAAVAAPVMAEQAPMAAPQENKDYYVQSIHFDVDSADLRAVEDANLAAMVEAAKAYPNNTLKLVGNTDSDASNDYNQQLSERRVRSVAQYAVDHGVTNQIVGLANGENKPAATNDTAQGKAENRRVDVYINR